MNADAKVLLAERGDNNPLSHKVLSDKAVKSLKVLHILINF
jgi:hypothetical protein